MAAGLQSWHLVLRMLRGGNSTHALSRRVLNQALANIRGTDIYLACTQGTARLTLVLAKGLRSGSGQQRQRQQRQWRTQRLRSMQEHCQPSM